MESSTAWFGVAIFALTLLLVLLCILAAGAVFYARSHRTAKRTVWPDVESGGGAEVQANAGNACSKKAARQLPMDLVETLRGLLKEEISKALQTEGISERLERLEHKDETSQGSVNTRLEQLERTAALRSAAEGDHAPRFCEEEPHCESRQIDFGPTNRQLQLPDPPENSIEIDEDFSLKSSLRTIQRQLHRRDAQTTELHRQLRQCQETLWERTLEARTSSKRLRDVLTDPSQVKPEHARELEHLQEQIRNISSKLADAKEAEMRWAWIAKRQRAFFMQSEKLGQEGMDLVRRHPAGEVFLSPPPVCLEGDSENVKNPPWDVGTSHLNPYAIDSWPFEPNVLAQKCAAEPNLTRLDEDGSGSESLAPSDEGSPSDEFCSEELGTPQPPGMNRLPGPSDIEPPEVPHPEVEMPSQTARSF